MALKKIEIDENERFLWPYRITVKRYSFVARLATLAQHGSIQRVIDGFFPRQWQKNAETVAVELRKLGYKDYEFYPSALQKRMGIKMKTGRRKRTRTLIA